jgi:hypothetical protein
MASILRIDDELRHRSSALRCAWLLPSPGPIDSSF